LTRRARLVAAMARPGLENLAFWSHVSSLAGPVECGGLYLEPPGGGWRLDQWLGALRRRLEPRAGLFAAVLGGGAVCASTAAVAKNGSTVLLYAAVPGPLGREAVLTAQPPAPSKHVPGAVLARLARRLLEDYGVSYLRLAARLAKLGGGEAALLLLVLRRGYPAPLVYYASTRGPCVDTVPGEAVAAYPGGCRPPGVVEARPRGGVVRVGYVELRDALRS